MQTFSFETGDDEKYELIEGGHTFHSEVIQLRCPSIEIAEHLDDK